MARHRPDRSCRSVRARHEEPRTGPPAVPGYELGSPLGFGATGAVWSATAHAGGPLRPGRRCAVAVLPLGDDERGAARSRRLRDLVGLSSPHLVEILDVVALPGACALVSERVDGPSLAALKAARPSLGSAEVAVVVGALAAALEELHARGVVHGDVSPANVLVRPDGSAVLVDLAAETGFEAGTAGFRPPERTQGAPASPAGDVWSAAATALWLVAPRERAAVEAALRPALAADPTSRCDARGLAACGKALGPAPALDLPGASSLARGRLRADPAVDQTWRDGRRRPGPRSRARAGRRDRRRAAHGRPAAAVLWVLGATAVGAGLAAGADAVHGARVLAGGRAVAAQTAAPDAVQDDPEEGSPATPAATGGEVGLEPSAVRRDVSALVRERDAALVAADETALAALSIAGSAVRAADLRLLEALDRSGTRISNLTTTVERIEVVAQGQTRAEVVLVTSQTPYTRSGPGGDDLVPAQPARCVVLTLGHQGGRWLPSRTRSCSPGGTAR